MRHINIPIFIPHLGCPNTCVFCNQRTISGVDELKPESVRDIIENALLTMGEDDECEIAFFGGSFTGIDFSLMVDLLRIADEFVRSGRVKSVRCSTRPDYIDDKILKTLKKYSVAVIELGLQSMSERVLQATRRGHTEKQAEDAVALIKEYGFRVCGQMMIGLPASSLEDEVRTAEFIVKSGCDMARIYPTVVFHGTELCCMTKRGEYKPLDTEDAVERSAIVLRTLISGGVEVIRIGLCDSENLHSDTTYFAGPNHPAIGEMVINRFYLKKISDGIKLLPKTGNQPINIYVSHAHMSKVVGQNKRNKRILSEMLGDKGFKFSELDGLREYEVLLEKDGKKICI